MVEKDQIIRKGGFEFGQDFFRRFESQRLTEEYFRSRTKEEYCWNPRLGDYNYGVLQGSFFPESPTRKAEEELIGTEAYLADLIELYLEGKTEKPIIVADIGGMVGLTWHRLAHHFAGPAKEGKVIFIVTNLGYTPKESDEILVRLPAERRKFLQETRNLVRHVVGSPRDLTWGRELSLGKVELSGKVDIIHESYSIHAHSAAPEDEIWRITKLLSSTGHYMIDRNYNPSAAISSAHVNIRRLMGLIEVDRVEEGDKRGQLLRYKVFRREQSPRIKVN